MKLRYALIIAVVILTAGCMGIIDDGDNGAGEPEVETTTEPDTITESTEDGTQSEETSTPEVIETEEEPQAHPDNPWGYEGRIGIPRWRSRPSGLERVISSGVLDLSATDLFNK